LRPAFAFLGWYQPTCIIAARLPAAAALRQFGCVDNRVERNVQNKTARGDARRAVQSNIEWMLSRVVRFRPMSSANLFCEKDFVPQPSRAAQQMENFPAHRED
jgi:hypothetical protein